MNPFEESRNKRPSFWKIVAFMLLSFVLVSEMLVVLILFVMECVGGRFSGAMFGGSLILISLSLLTICQTIILTQRRKTGTPSERILRFRARAIRSLVGSAGTGAVGVGIEKQDVRTLFVGVFICLLYLGLPFCSDMFRETKGRADG